MRFNELTEQRVQEGNYDPDLSMNPIDLSTNPSFKDIIQRYTQLVYQGHASETSPEEDQEHDEIEQYVADRFGEKGSAHLQKAAEVSYWGRDDGRGFGGHRSSNLGSASKPVGDFRTTKAGKMHSQDVKMMKSKVADRLGRHPEPSLPEQAMAEGPNDEKEDNFTIDDIKRLERIRDLETLKAQAKELIKGKPARRMKPEKISWFYNHIDTLKNPLAVIKMMYDLILAGEGNKVIGSRNSMSSNSYRTRFGEQGMAEAGMPFRGVGGAFNRGDDERHDIDINNEYRAVHGTWYIRIDGIIEPTPYRGKAAANAAALELKKQPGNENKLFMLTTKA